MSPDSSNGDFLRDTLALLKGLGPNFQTEIERLRELEQRRKQGRFHLAVLGQFKRGKSTFLNALLSESILPMGILPLTAIPTFVMAGSQKQAKVYFQDTKKPHEIQVSENPEEISLFLSRFVTETLNPRNRLGVDKVEIFHPAEILNNGVVLIDTPGVGSTWKHNTEATLNFLPQCDAAVFLVSVDPPLTEMEMDFLTEIQSKIPTLLFVLNKIDAIDGSECRDLVEFMKSQFRKLIGSEPTLFAVSSKNALSARIQKDATQWRKSGMEAIEEYLIQFLAQGKQHALDSAITVKVGNCIADVLMRLRLMCRSLEMPLAELQMKVNLFGEKLQDAAQERTSISDILTGDKIRLLDSLEIQLETLQEKARSFMFDLVSQQQAQEGHKWTENAARNALADSVPVFFEREKLDYTQEVEHRVRQILAQRQHRWIEIVQSVRQKAAEVFEIPYDAIQTEDLIPPVRQPVWMKYQWNSSLLPITPAWFDSLLPYRFRNRRIQNRIRRQVEYLASYNTGRIRGAMRDNIDMAFRSFSKEYEIRLDEIITALKEALRTTVSKRIQGSEEIKIETVKWKEATDRLKDLKATY
jgi:ribosome biogenesis GTPase A